MAPNPFLIWYPPYVQSVKDSIELMKKLRYNSIVLDIRHSFIQQTENNEFEGQRVNTTLTAEEWSYVTPKVGIDLIDSHNSQEQYLGRSNLKKALQKVHHASHLFLINLPMHEEISNINLARTVGEETKGLALVEVPIISPQSLALMYRNGATHELDFDFPWKKWSEFHALTNFHAGLRVALFLNSEHVRNITLEEIKRWLGEPIDCLVVTEELFNAKMTFDAEILKIFKLFLPVTSKVMIKTSSNKHKCKTMNDYVFDILEEYRKNQKRLMLDDLIAMPFDNLTLNLENYELFGRDPLKFQLYLKAIDKAIEDLKTQEIVKIAILGAKSESIIIAAAKASHQRGNCAIKIYDNDLVAIKIMQNCLKQRLEFDAKIQFFTKIGRNDEKVDILIGDCLSSFGDNYLAPEILFASRVLLKPEGICIPKSSKSFVCPVMSSKIYNKCKNFYRIKDYRAELNFTGHNLETTFFVNPVNFYEISEAKELFEFEYPNVEDFMSEKLLNFEGKLDATLHGFMGYFEAILYKDFVLSTYPFTKTSSWCAFFIPIKEPQAIKKGERIGVHFWRCGDKETKVWYEWKVEEPRPTGIHNGMGSSFMTFK